MRHQAARMTHSFESCMELSWFWITNHSKSQKFCSMFLNTALEENLSITTSLVVMLLLIRSIDSYLLHCRTCTCGSAWYGVSPGASPSRRGPFVPAVFVAVRI